MEKEIEYIVDPKENIYFSIRLLFTIGIYILVFYLLNSPEVNGAIFKTILFYLSVIVAWLFFRYVFLIGYLKGNAIKIGEDQFPDIYEIVKDQSKELNLRSVPDTYLLQSGGVLNAFATRFLGVNYIVIYSDVLDEAYQDNIDSLKFIIGHELGHIKREHATKKLFLLPSSIIPFLASAYSRACEYTCDSIGASLSPDGMQRGLILLAAGKKLYNKINIDVFINQKNTEDGFVAL